MRVSVHDRCNAGLHCGAAGGNKQAGRRLVVMASLSQEITAADPLVWCCGGRSFSAGKLDAPMCVFFFF